MRHQKDLHEVIAKLLRAGQLLEQLFERGSCNLRFNKQLRIERKERYREVQRERPGSKGNEVVFITTIQYETPTIT